MVVEVRGKRRNWKEAGSEACESITGLMRLMARQSVLWLPAAQTARFLNVCACLACTAGG